MWSRKILVSLTALAFCLIGLVIFNYEAGDQDDSLMRGALIDTETPQPARLQEGEQSRIFPKRVRAADSFMVPLAQSGITKVFEQALAGDDVILFQNVPGIDGFTGKVTMSHEFEDGSQSARLIGESIKPDRKVQKTEIYVVSTAAGYQGFIRKEGSAHVLKFSSDETSLIDLSVTKVPLEKFLCASFSGGELEEGIRGSLPGENDPVPYDFDSSDLRGLEGEEEVLGMAHSPSLEQAELADSTSAPPTGTPTIPKLSSRPGKNKVIFLDFDGHNLTGTVWNSDNSTIHVDSIVGNQVDSNFITEVWLKVSAAYSSFGVNVTTDETVFTNASPANRLRVLGSSDPAQIGKTNIGGVSYIGVFGNTYYQPSFFFVESYTSADSVARVINHESGHAMGLSHDGRSASPMLRYYETHGSSPRAWSTWMGSSYGADITQWSWGQYYLSSNVEDDLRIIKTVLGGVGPGASSMANPTNLPLPGVRNGSIVASTDADFYVIKGGMGKDVKIRLFPRNKSTSLFPDIQLLDASGNKIAATRFRSRNGLSMALNLTLPTDYVVVKVKGARFGTPWRPGDDGFPSGATNYGSLGPYTIKVLYN